MLKSILNLEGVQVLNKTSQKSIKGGVEPEYDCVAQYEFCDGYCPTSHQCFVTCMYPC